MESQSQQFWVSEANLQISDYMALGRDIYDFSVFVLINRVSCLGLYYQRDTVPNPPPPPPPPTPSQLRPFTSAFLFKA